MVNTTPALDLATLKARGQMLASVRNFFASRHILEVDTPILSFAAPIDAHIDVMTVSFANGTKGYLHTSPEYALKRLLAQHPVDLYQLCHVFREGESTVRHNPEFMMIEWYRMGFTLTELIHETIELIQLFLGSVTPTFFSYQQLFVHYTGMDPFHTSAAQLYEKAKRLELSLPTTASEWDIDTWLHYYMSFFLEPRMEGLMVIDAFPKSQAALAKLRFNGSFEVANRFEIFFNGLELANGFDELTDRVEQEKRFHQANHIRQEQGKSPLPIDYFFLKALEEGLPDCCGVAAGFDRLLMLQQKKSSIAEVFPFTNSHYLKGLAVESR